MSTGTIVAVSVGGLAVVGGVAAWIYFAGRADREAGAATTAAAAAAAHSAPAIQARKRSLGDAIATLGGRLLAEGAKFASVGKTAYLADLAQKAQKAA